ncbi:MAG: MBL fold metallo-hydrolase [Kiritimatiellia bacterium]|jgi:glyoxylase-like metal-dependent hydrolase (beta-lactamase superfamily II)
MRKRIHWETASAKVECLDASPGLWRVVGGGREDALPTNGYLLVRDGASLLIDCPSHDTVFALEAAGLPRPELILHTHVQEEHCREWSALPGVPVWVAEDSADLARVNGAFRAACATVWPPDRPWASLGADPYGIAGCVTERPPGQPLDVAAVFRPGETLSWRGIHLDVLALPGSSRHAVGFFWPEQRLLFSGDLIHAGGRLVNFYDIERCYNGGGGWTQMRSSCAAVEALSPRLLLPSTGPAIADPAADLARLSAWMARPLGGVVRRAGSAVKPVNYEPKRTFGRFREVAPGIYQNNQGGNMVLFVKDGKGLMIDPCNCVWTPWEASLDSFREDLALLGEETGLERVEVALVTHPHGDHMQDASLLRERYGTRILATPDTAALLARPRAYPYPCLLHWYDFPAFDSFRVDGLLAYGRTDDWRGTPITPVHTPGHCYAHSGFAVEWQGRCVFCAGDALQYGSGPIRPALPFCWNDNGFPDRSPAVAYRAIAACRPELVLCGHSQSFFDLDGSILRDFVEVSEAVETALVTLAPGDDLLRATTPPGYDAVRPPIEA